MCLSCSQQAAAKALKKLLKKQAEAAGATALAGKPRTSSMDLADVTNSRARTNSMNSDEGSYKNASDPALSSVKDTRTKEEKKEKKKRKVGEDKESTTKNTKKTKKAAKTGDDVEPVAADAVPAPAAPPAVGMTPKEFCSSHKITIQSDDENFAVPPPMATFDSTPFGGHIRQALEVAGYPAPTPTQAQSWPIAISGRDIISVARTGSGKTLGFLLPSFHTMMNRPGGMRVARGAGPFALVLSPTRELACQINEEATKFGRTSGIRSTTVYGELAVSGYDSLN